MGHLRLHLERHLDTHGRLVPIFVNRTGDPVDLSARLRAAQQKILQCFADAHGAITHWDGSRGLTELRRLAALLEALLEAEDELIHPVLEDLVPRDLDWDALHFQVLMHECAVQQHRVALCTPPEGEPHGR